MDMAGSMLSALDVSVVREELKYTRASNVNVSNFVSVKLSGHKNYDIWKAQMLCLIKSQALLHIIDAENPLPDNNGVHMLAQYDQLVKGWIFGSLNEKVLKDLVNLSTAQEVWIKLESSFTEPVSDTEGSSSNIAVDVSALDAVAPVVSPIREDLKYIQASSVNVSSFVSVKLSGLTNYNIWKAQMTCLLESQDLLHILDDQYHFPVDKGVHMILYYDRLVKGWIFGSMNEKVLKNFAQFKFARNLWWQLEYFYNPPTRPAEVDSRSTPAEHQKYVEALDVIVSRYVPEKLSGHSNYMIWKDQMLGLIESQQLQHTVDAEIPFPEDKGVHMISQYDRLVRDWIFCSMKENMLREFQHFNFARDLWSKLESTVNPLLSYTDEGYSPDATEDLKFMQTSNVNPAGFLSVKLSGHNNYDIWKAQMLCLVTSQGLLHIIDYENPFPDDKSVHMFWQYNELVRGWILGSMNEEMLIKDVLGCKRVRDLWKKLESLFDPSVSDQKDSVGFMFGIESVCDDPDAKNKLWEWLSRAQEIDSNITRKRLYEAAVEGCWWKAKSILNVQKNTAIEAITGNGNTILHVAVEMGHNYFVEKLLEFLTDARDIETKNYKGRTSLHTAAMVGNECAAKLLVQKRKELLEIVDYDEKTPLHITFSNLKLDLAANLLKFTPPSYSDTLDDNCGEGAIVSAIYTKQYDLAGKLLEKYSECASQNGIILYVMAITFPTDLTFMESLMYPSFHDILLKTVKRCSLLFHSSFWDKCVDDVLRIVKICNNMCCSWLGDISMILLVLIATLYPIYLLICLVILVLRLTFSMVYFLLWKVLAVPIRPIKNIETKKKDYKEAKRILSLICNQMGKSNPGYKEPIIEAVREGAYEVVNEILFMSPAALNYTNEEGHNIIQLAITNRSEKVYNLIHHIIEHTASYRIMTDSFENNLVHLVGRLAPSFVLDRTTGAALQLQRELLWRQEVEKLMLPIDLRNKNIYQETPAMVFSREHQDLIKQGESWMKTTAESCSITAALIVTVVFAAAITVPGGSNQETGIPMFKKDIAFTIFAISNAFSLFTAATSLLLFLSILTARFSERDFLVSLPRRLIFGLLTLFLSTTAMILAFGAILFLVFCDQKPWMLAPICVFACLPISVIVTIKLPLLIDLITSTYVPIFGNQSYLKSCKINKKNTIFTD